MLPFVKIQTPTNRVYDYTKSNAERYIYIKKSNW